MKRITVTIDNDLDRRIRSLQANLISSTQKGWSYSKVLTTIAEKGLDHVVIKKLNPKHE